MYALGRFIYTLDPRPSPNAVDERSKRGEKIFHEEGCAKCHEPPTYTNNQLVRASDWKVPENHPDRDRVMTATVETDPSLAMRTRKGTGFYSIPSLRGVWYRGLFEHSGSVRTLEDWFDPKRLTPEYVPTGWKGPGVTARAVPGHEYGPRSAAGRSRGADCVSENAVADCRCPVRIGDGRFLRPSPRLYSDCRAASRLRIADGDS